MFNKGFDINKRKELGFVDVGELIEILNKLPRDSKVLFNGSLYGYIHMWSDESTISFDSEDLDEDYEEN